MSRTEKDKMLAGESYNAADQALVAERLRARELCQALAALATAAPKAERCDLLARLFGPAVQVYTATHPVSAQDRRSGLEFAKPITIENDVWLGGSAVVCPGVTIGSGSVIGAGSVVVRDVPAGVVAAGNPCRVIRRL